MNTSSTAPQCVKEAARILGDKWTPQLLRHFMSSPSLRFCQIESLVDGINPRTLSARLVTLEDEGIVEKVTSEDSSRCEYRLTEKGKSLTPIVTMMGQWSSSHAQHS